jgi:phosphatidylserine/phosphatidylglycerophosphate/cardiolipin synthase-like enzyme
MTVDLPPAPAVAAAQPAPPAATIFFGGVDQPPRALRDLLLARVQAAPAGSEIAWATYYLRDPELAEALIAAKRRGVRVRVVIEETPRRRNGNETIIAQLQAGLGDDLRVHRGLLPGAHLHAKIYTFTGPDPQALIGSFNPTISADDDPQFIRKIGDQDRGENLLVDYRDPAVVKALRKQALRLWSGKANSPLSRFRNPKKRLPELTLFYYPRFRPGVVDKRIRQLGPGDTVRAAISHMDRGPFAQQLAEAAQRGAKIEVIVDDAQRRVADNVVDELEHAGVEIRRFCDADRLPMHAKFVIVDRKDQRAAWFGSFNYNFGSRYLNQEVLARTTNAELIGRLEDRFQLLADEAGRRTCVRG